MPDLTVRFDIDKPELASALAEVLRAEPEMLKQPGALDSVRHRLATVAPAVELSGSEREWRLDGEAPAFRLPVESPQEAGLPPVVVDPSDAAP